MRYLSFLIIIGPLFLEFVIFAFLIDVIGVLLVISLSIFTLILGVLIVRITATSIFKVKHINFNFENDLLKNIYSEIWSLFGGMLLIFPGFFSDLIGIILIFPVTRRYLIKLLSLILPKSNHINLNNKSESEGPIIDVPYEDLTNSRNHDN